MDDHTSLIKDRHRRQRSDAIRRRHYAGRHLFTGDIREEVIYTSRVDDDVMTLERLDRDVVYMVKD